jgi:hypothetical protein
MSVYGEQVLFAAGTLVGQRVDVAGPPTPFGILQDVTVDFLTDIKSLHGQGRYAVMQAPGKSKIEMKAKFAKIQGNTFNELYFGAVKTAAQTKFADNEPGTIPAVPTAPTSSGTASGSTLHFSSVPAAAVVGALVQDLTAPSAISAGTLVASTGTGVVNLSQAVASAVGSGDTISFSPSITVQNAGDFIQDMGVYFAATGQLLTPVASNPAQGEYSASGGIYIFNAADAGLGVYISYTYSTSGGVKLAVVNLRMGVGPSFQITLTNPFDGRQGTFTFPNCMAGKLSLPTKQDDFTIAEMDFSAAGDIAGNICSINLDQ